VRASVRPSVRPSFRGRLRSPARFVKRRKRRINKKTHNKRHSKTPSCCLPRTTAKSDTKVCCKSRDVGRREERQEQTKGGREKREETQKREDSRKGVQRDGNLVEPSRPHARPVACDSLHPTGWLPPPPPRNRSGQRGNTYLPGHRETGYTQTNLEVPRLKQRSLASLR
jgi:hypothetical protein